MLEQKEKITIGLFIDTFFPMIDGVTMVVDNYAKRLKNYANVIVFAPKMYNDNFDDSKLPYKVVRCKSVWAPFIDYSLPVPSLDLKFMKELNSYNLDIVHIHSPATLGKIGIKYAKKNKIPVIASMHSQYRQDIRRFVKSKWITNVINRKLMKIIFDRCDECWAVNNELANIFYYDYKCKKMPSVMNNATEMKPIKNKKEAKTEITKKYNIKNDEKILLFVGRLNKLKNIYLIVDSLKIIKQNNPDFKYKMLFVGNGQDQEGLKHKIKNNNMENEIILCGKTENREELARYYSSADLLLFPSLYDSSSIVQIESASQKTPGLFLNGAVTAEGIIDNENGYLENNNANDYAKRILEIFENEEQYRKVCENAYRDIYINWDDMIAKVYSKYTEIINK